MITAEAGSYSEIDEVRTFCIKLGRGPALVLIHGGAPGASSTVNWGENIEYFAEAGYTVYAYDQPGLGRTDDPSDLSMEYRVTHARAFIDAMGLDRFCIMGNSQGSYIAARIALEDPRVEKLVLVASGTLAPRGSAASDELSREHSERLRAYTPSLENMRALTSQTLFNPERVTDELVQERYLMSLRERPQSDGGTRPAGPRPIYEDLKNLTTPTLIVWGAQDSGAAVERALLLLQAIPGAELHVFDRAAHWVQWDQTERFNTLVRDFLTA